MQSNIYKASMQALILVSTVWAVSACATNEIPSPDMAEADATAQVDLRVATDATGEMFETRSRFTVPSEHKVGDKLFPYEGIGWENEIVGYRLYLDERAVTDIFGKRTPELVLDKVDYRGDYHSLADWGMDVLKVGPSLGVGGLGLYRDGELNRLGHDGDISVDVIRPKGNDVAFTLSHTDVLLSGGLRGNISTTYSIQSGSPLTWVSVKSDVPPETLVTGLVTAPDSERLRNSNTVEKGQWRYIASWGDERSEAKDGLGMILFYRQGEARLMPTTNETYTVRFNGPNPKYAFAGVWEQGPMGITDEASFIAWADKQQAALNK